MLLLEAGWIEVMSHFGPRANLTLSSCERLPLSPPTYPTQTHKRGASRVSVGIRAAVAAASVVGKHLGAAWVPGETQAAPVFPAPLSKIRIKAEIVRQREGGSCWVRCTCTSPLVRRVIAASFRAGLRDAGRTDADGRQQVLAVRTFALVSFLLKLSLQLVWSRPKYV